jgi:hypothetical protein
MAIHDGQGFGNAHPSGSGNGHTNGANGANGDEPAWLQRLKAGRFDKD